MQFLSRWSNAGRLDAIANALAALTASNKSLHQKIGTIMSALDDLRAQVEQVKTVDAAAIALLNGLKASLDAAVAAGDMSAVAALTADLGANTSALAAAVTANTPAAPPP